MLHHLVQYARDHALVAEPGFAPKAVRWAIILDATGRLLDVLPLGDVNSKKNPNPVQNNFSRHAHFERGRVFVG